MKALVQYAGGDRERVVRIDHDRRDPWRILICDYSKREKLHRDLGALGCTVYEPLRIYDMIQRRTKRRIQRTVPLLGEYVLAIVPESAWFELAAVAGVRGYLRAASSESVRTLPPAAITNAEVVRLMEAEANDQFNSSIIGEKRNNREARQARLERQFPTGAERRIIDGSLIGMSGTVIRVEPTGRVTVEVEIFGRPVEATLDADQLEEAS